jgi:hypothetical protein
MGYLNCMYTNDYQENIDKSAQTDACVDEQSFELEMTNKELEEIIK